MISKRPVSFFFVVTAVSFLGRTMAGDGDLGSCAGYLPGSIQSATITPTYPWLAAAFQGPEGTDAIRSSTPFEVGQPSTAEVSFTGPGIASFQWRVSSLAGDGLLICQLSQNPLIGGFVECGRISGTSGDWIEMDVFVPQGVHRLRWTYQKGTVGSAGEDSGLIADLAYQAIAASLQNYSAFLDANSVTGSPIRAANGLRMDTCWLMGIDPNSAVPAGLLDVVLAGGEAKYRVRYSLKAENVFMVQHSDDLQAWAVGSLRSRLIPGTTTANTVDFEFIAPLAERHFFQSEHQPSFRSPDGDYVYLAPGVFQMGSPNDELGRIGGDENYQHQVSFTKGFYLKKHETTYGEWVVVRDWARANGYSNLGYRWDPELNAVGTEEMAASGGRFLLVENGGETGNSAPSVSGASNQPVSNVSWVEAVRWLNAKSEMEGLTPCYSITFPDDSVEIFRNQIQTVEMPYTDLVFHCDWNANGYRLPTDAEWEFACRGGTTTALSSGKNLTIDNGQEDTLDPSFGAVDPHVDGIAWFWYNGAASRPVGQKPANPHGLFDMHGNIAEWCWDIYDPAGNPQFSGAAVVDPRGPVDQPAIPRVYRGGCWRFSGRFIRSASRTWGYSTIQAGYLNGFRIAQTAPE